jgi:hypothetical protein
MYERLANRKAYPFSSTRIRMGGVDETKPLAGRDYPRTWSEFQDWFASDEVCAAYLEQRR